MKLSIYIRKFHRYLTPFFLVFTILNMFILPIPIINMIQRVLMLTLAVTGSYLFVHIYYRKHKNKKRTK